MKNAEIFGMKVVISDIAPPDMIAFCLPVTAQTPQDRIVLDQVGGSLVGVELVARIVNAR
jgi:hypothetical protein